MSVLRIHPILEKRARKGRDDVCRNLFGLRLIDRLRVFGRVAIFFGRMN